MAWEVSELGKVAALEKDLRRISDSLDMILGGPGDVEGILLRIKQLNEMRLDTSKMMTKYCKDFLEDIEELRATNKQLEVELAQSRINCDHLQADWDTHYGHQS